MKTLVEKWTYPKDHSFNIKKYSISRLKGEQQNFLMRMHDEYEITIIKKGSGKRVIGNAIENFTKGDVFLMGPHLPHCIQADEGCVVEGITIHFLMDTIGINFFKLPENQKLLQLLEEMKLGISFKGKHINDLFSKLDQLMKPQSFDRLVGFLQLLHEISNIRDKKVISNHGFTMVKNIKEYKLVNKTYEYIITNFDSQNISLDEISSYVNMSPATFCRFFKKHYQKTYTNFMNEVRIGHACKLLQETNENIAQIAYSTGYNHLTHFNKQFKKIIGYSPKEYKRTLN